MQPGVSDIKYKSDESKISKNQLFQKINADRYYDKTHIFQI